MSASETAERRRPVYALRVCRTCQKDYQPASPAQKFCTTCSPWMPKPAATLERRVQVIFHHSFRAKAAAKPRRRAAPRICQSCRQSYQPRAGAQKRCDTCRTSLSAPAGRLQDARVCRRCEHPFQPNSSNQIRCTPCAEAVQAEYNRANAYAFKVRQGTIRDPGKRGGVSDGFKRVLEPA